MRTPIFSQTHKFTYCLSALAFAAALSLAGCGGAPGDQSAGEDAAPSAGTAAPISDVEVLTDAGLSGMTTREIIDHLDRLPLDERPTSFVASVRPSELLVTSSDGEETSLPIEDDSFYLSFAPYVDQTHECYFHSLTTCVGELQEVPIKVRFVDDATGEVLVDEETTTFKNGFLGVWLPRNIDGTLTVEHQGMSGQAQITTRGDEALTCLASMQLS